MQAFVNGVVPGSRPKLAELSYCDCRTRMNVASMDKLTSIRDMFRDFIDGIRNEKVVFEEVITSADLETEAKQDLILLTTMVKAKVEEADKMARSLKSLQEATLNYEPRMCQSMSITRDPENPNVFQVVEIMAGISGMTAHQKTPHYQAFIREVQPLLEDSLAVHIVKIRDGKMTDGVYPYGPCGEGGRDDMVFR